MSPVDEGILSSQNFNEKENELPKYIKELRQMMKEENVAIPFSDDVLIRFIRGRKFNLERVCKTLKKYLNMKKKYRSIVGNSDPRSFEFMYPKNVAVVFANRDSKGRQILFIRSRKWNPSDICLLQGLIAIYVIIEGMIGYLETQRCGISIILDLKDLSFHQARLVTFKCLQIVGDIAQDTLPVSFQEIHVVNNPLMFNMIWALLKSLLKEKLRNRFHFHGYNLKSLHKFVSPNILPYNLGGKLTNQEAWDQTFIPKLLEQNDFYKDYLQPIEDDDKISTYPSGNNNCM